MICADLVSPSPADISWPVFRGCWEQAGKTTAPIDPIQAFPNPRRKSGAVSARAVFHIGAASRDWGFQALAQESAASQDGRTGSLEPVNGVSRGEHLEYVGVPAQTWST